jgi:fibronectin-binding autotransporter adhesin
MHRKLAVLCLAVSLSGSMSAGAADGSWAVDASGNWSDAANWSGGVAATGLNATAFFTNAITGDRVVSNDYAGPLTVGKLAFDAGAGSWTLAGGALQLVVSTGSSTVNVSSGSAAIASVVSDGSILLKAGPGRLVLRGANTYTGGTVVAGGTIAISAPNNLGSAVRGLTLSDGTLDATNVFLLPHPVTVATGTVYVADASSVTITNAFTLTGSLVKEGPGALTISNSLANGGTYNARPVTVSGGVLAVNPNRSDTVGSISIASNATFRSLRGDFIVNTAAITVEAGGTFDMNGFSDAIGFLAGDGSVTNTGGIVLDLGAGTSLFGGAIAGTGPITVRGANAGTTGVQVLSGSNTFTGALTLQAGTLSVGVAENLGGPASSLAFAGGALRVTGTTLTNLNGRTVNWATFNGALDIADAANVFTVSSAIGGTGALTKRGEGTLALSGVNTFSGATTVNGGTLRLKTGAALNSAALNVNSGGTLALDAGSFLNFLAVLSVNSTGKVSLATGFSGLISGFKVNGINQAAGTWGATGSGAAHTNDAIFSGAGTINVATGYDGLPADGSWGVNNSGIWGDTNNWTGGIVGQGTNRTAFFTNSITADRTVTNTYAALDIGRMVFGSPANNWNVAGNPVSLAVTSGVPTIAVNSNRATVAAPLGGAQGFAKTGAGMLALSGTNTYSGDTAVDAGVLNLQNGSALGDSGAISVANAARLELQGNITVSGKTNTLAGDGGNFFGALQTASGSNTWAGPVILGANGARLGIGAAGGTLVVAGPITDGASSFPLILRGQTPANSTVILAGAGSYGGDTELIGVTARNAGDDRLNTAGALSNRAVAAQYDLNGFNQTVAGVGVADDGNLAISNSGAASATLTLSGGATHTYRVGGIAGAMNAVKAGSGTQVFASINNTFRGSMAVNAGALVVSGGVFNSSVSLASGAVLVAAEGPGLAGEYYTGLAPVAANFNTPQALGALMGALDPSLLYNFPPAGTNFDFGLTGNNFPPGVPNANIQARWTGSFVAPTNGAYTFETISDDGSMLWVDGALVVNNNGSHGMITNRGAIALSAGGHDILVAYFQGAGAYGLFANVALPGGVTNRISNGLVRSGPAIGSLSGAAGSMLVLSNTVLTVAQTNDGTFAGNVMGAGALRKIGAATLSLTGANSVTNWILGGGRLSIGDESQVGGPDSRLVFDGGLLQVTGTAISNLGSHSVNFDSFNGGFDVADAAHALLVTNAITGPGALAKAGPGTLVLAADNTYAGATTVREGLLLPTGTNAATGSGVFGTPSVLVGNQPGATATLTLPSGSAILGTIDPLVGIGAASGARGVLNVMDGANLSLLSAGVGLGNGLYVGCGIGASTGFLGVVNQRGGTVTVDDRWMVAINGGYGFYSMTNGTLNLPAVATGGNPRFRLSDGMGGVGLFYVSGGAVTANVSFGIVDQAGGPFPSPGGKAAFHIDGGTLVANAGMGMGRVSGYGVATIDGSAFVDGRAVNMGMQTNGTGVLNLRGGTCQVNSIAGGVGRSVLNFNGGTLRAGANGAVQTISEAYVYPGGAMIDTSTNTLSLSANLQAPAGSGVTGIPVLDGGTNFLGAPYVEVTGGGGSNATAIARIDPASGAVIGLEITNPGNGYSGAPTVSLLGGGGSNVVLGTVTTGANGSGGLTKLGSGVLALNGTNSYGDDTIVQEGILLVGSTQAVGNGAIFLATNNAGVGASVAMDQPLLNWIVSRLDGEPPRVLAIGADTANNLDLSSPVLANVSLGAGGGSSTFSGGLTGIGTNLYLGGSPGTLTYAPVIGSGTNVFIGFGGGAVNGVVTLSGSNGAYGSEINVQSGTLRPGVANALGGATARVVVAGGTVLDVNGQNLGPVQVFVEGSGISGQGAIVNSGAAQTLALQYATLTGNATFGGQNRWDIRGTNTVLDLAGFTLTKTNANVVALVGGIMTDGDVVIGQGVFGLHAGAAATGSSSTITIQPSGTLDFYATPSPTVTVPVMDNGGLISVTAGGVSIIGSPVTLAGATNPVSIAAGNSLVLTGLLGGAGVLVTTGGGTLSLTSTEAYTGQTIVNAGTLELGANNTLGSSAGLVVSGGEARVTVNDGLFGTNARPVRASSAGRLNIVNAAARLRGPLTLAGGILDGSGPDPLRGCWALENTVDAVADSLMTATRVQLGVPGGVVFNVTNGATLGVASVMEDPELGAAGVGTLFKAGGGTLALAGSNRYSGATVVNEGTVRLLRSGTVPVLPASLLYRLDASDANQFVFDGGGRISQWNDASGNGRHFAQAVSNMRPTYVATALNGKPAVRFDGATNQLILGSGTTPLTVILVTKPVSTGGDRGVWGSWNNDVGFRLGTAGWHGDNRTTDADISGQALSSVYTNGVFGANANMPVAANVPVVVSVVRTNGATLFANTGLGYYTTVAGANRFYQGDISEVLAFSGALSNADRMLAESYLMAKWFSTGAVQDALPTNTALRIATGASVDLGGVNQAVGSLSDYAGAGGVVANDGATGVTFTVGNDGSDAAFSGVIRDGTGTVALTKVEAGALTLAGSNTYSGATLVSDGALLVNGSLGSSEVTIFSGATLGGTGTIGGSVANDGVVAPGASVGRLTIGGTFFQFGGALAIEISGLAPGSGHDQLAVGGDATAEGTLTVTTPSFTPAAGNAFTILTASAVSGPFAATNLPSLPAGLSWGVNYQPGAIVLEVSGTATSRYDTWTSQFGLVQGPEGDDDTDGYRNLLEYATGANPTNIDTMAKMNGGKTNGVLYLRFTRDPDSTDVRYWVEGSHSASNNAVWTGLATNIAGSWGGAPNVQETGVNPRTVTVSDTVVATQRFMRLRVTKP